MGVGVRVMVGVWVGVGVCVGVWVNVDVGMWVSVDIGVTGTEGSPEVQANSPSSLSEK